MDKHWPTVCAFLAFCALAHFDTILSARVCCTSTVKSGVCPRRRLGYGRCAEFCSNDGDCPDKKKCCSNGCGHECMAPYVVKPGRCPLPDTTPMCAEYCYHDGQCPGAQKCCRTTCGHACSAPC